MRQMKSLLKSFPVTVFMLKGLEVVRNLECSRNRQNVSVKLHCSGSLHLTLAASELHGIGGRGQRRVLFQWLFNVGILLGISKTPQLLQVPSSDCSHSSSRGCLSHPKRGKVSSMCPEKCHTLGSGVFLRLDTF